jgi:mannosyltransferase
VVHIDGIVFSLQSYGGITVYFNELLRRMSRAGVPTVISVETPLKQQPGTYADSMEVVEAPARPLERYRSCRLGYTPAVFHSTYYRRPERREVPTLVTVHDFIYERYRTGLRRWVHSAQKTAAIRAAHVVVCVSEATRQDLLEFVGETPGQQICVIHNGVSEAFHPVARPPRMADRPFVLFVGDRRGYKNFGLLLSAMTLVPELELHCVGGGGFRPSELNSLTTAQRERVRHLGFVSEQTLNDCYNDAVCLAYPSAYEGFGIPVAEAMRAGCPVVSTRCAAVLEIGGAALTVADSDPEALAKAILLCLDPAHRGAVRAAGLAIAGRYTWPVTHRATLEIYRKLGASIPEAALHEPCVNASV